MPLSPEHRCLVAGVAEGVLAVRPLLAALDPPIRARWQNGVALSGRSDAAGDLTCLVNRMASRLRVPPIELYRSRSGKRLGAFDDVVGRRVTAQVDPLALSGASSLDPHDVAATIDEVLDRSFEHVFPLSELATFDGLKLRAYASKGWHRKAVVFVAPCGMPAMLCQRWMRFLSQEHFVATWESRGLFGPSGPFDGYRHDVASQAEDLFRVMDHFRVDQAHIMGVCGGAVIALEAAARRPRRVVSVSLWHGDFDVRSQASKTDHQRNLGSLMAAAGEDRESAAAVRSLFCETALDRVAPDIAHLVLYPFANDELMFRYGRLNGAIMTNDVRSVVRSVHQPTLVVTSEKDATAHPAGSRVVAKMLTNAILHIETHGDHLSLFEAAERSTRLAAAFIDRTYDQLSNS